MCFWDSLAFLIIQRMLAIWSLISLPFLKAAWTSGSSWFMYCWSLTWRILSITLLMCEKEWTNWFKKKKKTQDPYKCCVQEIYLKPRATYRLKVRVWKKIFHANRDQKKVGVAIIIPDKTGFQIKTIKRDKERST